MQRYSSDVNLEEVDLELEEDDVEEVNIYEDLTYPCLVIRGITLVQELDFFGNLHVDEKRSLPLYVEFEGSAELLGKLELTIDNMLLLNTIGGGAYKLELCKTKTDRKELSIDKADNLVKMIDCR